MNHLKNIGALKADYEAGINSKVDIAKKTWNLSCHLVALCQQVGMELREDEGGGDGITFPSGLRAFGSADRIGH